MDGKFKTEKRDSTLKSEFRIALFEININQYIKIILYRDYVQIVDLKNCFYIFLYSY